MKSDMKKWIAAAAMIAMLPATMQAQENQNEKPVQPPQAEPVQPPQAEPGQMQEPAQPGQAQRPAHPGQMRQVGMEEDVTAESATEMIAQWPKSSKEAGEAMIQKYGPPNEATASMLVWYGNGPWTHTIVYREPVQHDFPVPHEDVLEQFVHYRVPADKFDDLAQFDGSVIAERTKGVLSARCDKEGANILALNLADDIITGKKTVEEAREFYGETIKAKMSGQSPEYMSGLRFDVTNHGNTADPDETTVEVDKGNMKADEMKAGEMKPNQPQPKMNERSDEMEKDAPKPEMDAPKPEMDDEMDDDSGM